MATYTPNFNLEKPDASDQFGNFRALFNGNMDIIDANLGGGGGSSTLGGLDDVNIQNPTDGQALVYDANADEWINGNVSSGDTVSWTQIQPSGTKIAEIEINGTQTDVYAPSGGSGSISLVVTCDSDFIGETLTLTGDTVLTAVVPAEMVVTFSIPSLGTWVLTNSLTADSESITMDFYGNYHTTLSSAPDGSTVTPTDDVSIWLLCGRRSENYTTLLEVLNDSTCLSALISDNNATDYLVRSATFATAITADSSAMSYIGLNNYCSNTLLSDSTWRTAILNSAYSSSVLNVQVPPMTSDTTPSGTVVYSDQLPPYVGYRAFDGVTFDTLGWAQVGGANAYIGYIFTSLNKVFKVQMRNRNETTPRAFKQFKIQGTTDGATWEDITGTITNSQSGANALTEYLINPNVKYFGYRLYSLTDSYDPPYIGVGELQFIGRVDV